MTVSTHDLRAGDKLRVINDSGGSSFRFTVGQIVTFAGVDHGGLVQIEEDSLPWSATRFEPAGVADEPSFGDWASNLEVGAGWAGNVLVINHSPAHLRPYDFNAGDERKFTQGEALERARHRVTSRGCRQQVRCAALEDERDARLTPRWLVQDI